MLIGKVVAAIGALILPAGYVKVEKRAAVKSEPRVYTPEEAVIASIKHRRKCQPKWLRRAENAYQRGDNISKVIVREDPRGGQVYKYKIHLHGVLRKKVWDLQE